ncbi:glycosyltransferase family 2 protein [Archangium lansingense]|uniref:glycosyltransferase family 2 protein n=1 Tax=Archangium lansingense TaxID=2995310 RepID=UPI003B7E002C
MPKVSIVVPVYNLELYIERCLESLVNQTLQDIEILVVDDGSTDDSSLLIGELAERYPSLIRVFTKVNGGHGSACNHGIDRARGEYVMIVDGDDFLDPDTTRFMYEKARSVRADLLIGNLRYIHSGSTSTHQPLSFQGEKLLDEADWPLLFQNWATPCGRLYKRKLFEDPRLRFLPGIIFADVNFAPKTYLAAERIHYVNEELYNYDVTRPTQSIRQTDKRVLNVVPALRDMLDFYKAKGQFEACRPELLGYVVRHCFAWIGKVETLHGYPRQQALAELFSVLDEHFGDEWTTSEALRQVAGRRRSHLIRAARRLAYAPLVWSWELRKANQALDARVEHLLNEPLRHYRSLRTQVERQVIDRLSI